MSENCLAQRYFQTPSMITRSSGPYEHLNVTKELVIPAKSFPECHSTQRRKAQKKFMAGYLNNRHFSSPILRFGSGTVYNKLKYIRFPIHLVLSEGYRSYFEHIKCKLLTILNLTDFMIVNSVRSDSWRQIAAVRHGPEGRREFLRRSGDSVQNLTVSNLSHRNIR